MLSLIPTLFDIKYSISTHDPPIILWHRLITLIGDNPDPSLSYTKRIHSINKQLTYRFFSRLGRSSLGFTLQTTLAIFCNPPAVCQSYSFTHLCFTLHMTTHFWGIYIQIYVCTLINRANNFMLEKANMKWFANQLLTLLSDYSKLQKKF